MEFVGALMCMAMAVLLGCLAVAAYLTYKFWIVRATLGVIGAISVVIYGVLVVYSYHGLLSAERACMPDYSPLKAQHIERVVIFDVVGWDLSYKRKGSYWQDPGNPVIMVNLLGRVVAAEPPYIMGAVNRYQGSQLEP